MYYLATFLRTLIFSVLLTGCKEASEATTTNTAAEPTRVESRPENTAANSFGATADTMLLRRISSQVLGYDLQYWVQLPAQYQAGHPYPTLYVTDGWWYKEDGGLPEIARELMQQKQIQDIILVYVDAYDPDNQANNRRNSQFLCKPNYVQFYKEELVPAVDGEFSTETSPSQRAMLGVSFGGLNSMYFGIHAYDTFGKIGIQSPAPHPCPDIYADYENNERLPIDIFLSTGTVNDKAKATRRLKRILEDKAYDFAYEEVPFGHTWANWTPLLDDVLLRFFGNTEH